MNEEIMKLLEGNADGALDPASRQLILQAFQEKVDQARQLGHAEGVAEARQTLEPQLREEMAQRVDASNDQVAQAMGNFMEQTIDSEMEDFHAERRELLETRERCKRELEEHIAKLDEFVNETLEQYAESMKAEEQLRIEQLAEMTEMVNETVASLTEELRQERKDFVRKIEELNNFVYEELARDLNEKLEHREQQSLNYEKLKGQTRKMWIEAENEFLKRDQEREERKNAEIKALNDLLNEEVDKEMQEFHEERKARLRQHIKFIAEGEQKLEETKKAFIDKFSVAANDWLNDIVTHEMDEMKDDISEASKNRFGRRLFETFAVEYMASFLGETKDERELKDKLQEALVKAEKARTVAEAAVRERDTIKVELERAQILEELTGPMQTGPKNVMNKILEHVETKKLRKVFAENYDDVIKETASAGLGVRPIEIAPHGSHEAGQNAMIGHNRGMGTNGMTRRPLVETDIGGNRQPIVRQPTPDNVNVLHGRNPGSPLPRNMGTGTNVGGPSSGIDPEVQKIFELATPPVKTDGVLLEHTY